MKRLMRWSVTVFPLSFTESCFLTCVQFEAKLNAREFERYQCHGQAALLSIGLGLTDRNEVERLSSVEDVFGEKSGVSVAEGHSLGAKI